MTRINDKLFFGLPAAAALKFLTPVPDFALASNPLSGRFLPHVERTISTGDSTCFAAFLGVYFVRLATVSIRYSRLDCTRQSTGESRDIDSGRALPDRNRS